MKRFFMTIVFVGCAATASVRAADDVVSDAAALAARQDAEERYKRLQSAYDELQAAQVALQKRVAQMADEVRSLREVMTRAGDNNATREDLKRLAEQLHELDKRRLDDNQKIVEQIKNLVPPAPTAPRSTPTPKVTAPVAEKGFEYTIQKDDTLSAVVRSYNEELKKQGKNAKITLRQVLDANPNLDEKKLRVGQKIFIPLPPQ